MSSSSCQWTNVNGRLLLSLRFTVVPFQMLISIFSWSYILCFLHIKTFIFCLDWAYGVFNCSERGNFLLSTRNSLPVLSRITLHNMFRGRSCFFSTPSSSSSRSHSDHMTENRVLGMACVVWYLHVCYCKHDKGKISVWSSASCVSCAVNSSKLSSCCSVDQQLFTSVCGG